MQVVQTLEEQEWNQFLNHQSMSNIFHTPEMSRVFSRTENHDPILWAVKDDKDCLLCLLPAVQIRHSRLIPSMTTRAVAYGSVLYQNSPDGLKALHLMLSEYKKKTGKALLLTELRNLADQSEAQPIFEDLGFMYTDELNFLVDLKRPIEDILQNIGPRTRKHIRRGLRSGDVKFSEITGHDQLDSWYALLQRTYSQARIPLADRSLFYAVLDELVPKTMARFFTGSVNGKTVVCSVILLYGGRVYDWYGGVDRDYSRYTPSEMMIWHELEWGKENGYDLFDLGLAGSPQEEYGVREFKAKFRGKQVCFGRNTYLHRPLAFRIMNAGYKAYRLVWKGRRAVTKPFNTTGK